MRSLALASIVTAAIPTVLVAADPAPEPPADSSSVAPVTSPDSAAVAPAAPPFEPDPTVWELSTFRLSRSADLELVSFGELDDPMEPIGTLSMADVLRLSPEVRTRELSQGPTVETFELRGGGSGRSAFLWPGRSLTVPGTSGPHTHEVMLSEVSELRILRGGAAALYGPGAASGVVVVRPRELSPDQLHSRAMGEEGVDDYQRGAFQVASRIGPGAVFLTTESRRTDGFYAGTKEVDRQFSGVWRGRLPFAFEGSFGYRLFKGDGRTGFFDPATIGHVLTYRDEIHVSLFRRTRNDRGALLEVGLLREDLENEDGTTQTRDIRSPRAELTFDLPDLAGIRWTARAELAQWRIDHQEVGDRDQFMRWGGAVRATCPLGSRAFVTGTVRTDGQDQDTALQARLEGEWALGRLALFGVASRGEHYPDRGAEGSETETHDSATLGLRLRVAPLVARVAAFGTRIGDLRPGPEFDAVQARQPVLGAPVGDAEITGGTVGFETERFAVPGVRFLGSFLLRSSFTQMATENVDTGDPLPGRPERTWTGEGLLERRFFKGELLARVRGRLTHYGDRVDAEGLAVRDVWLTDVILEGEIGDAAFFYRIHDLLERMDEVEPGFFFPGFSRYLGITWRFFG